MATVHLDTLLKNSILAQIQIAIDAGAGPGTVKFYTGVMPTLTTDAVTTQTLLGTLIFSDPCGATADGALTMNAITSDASADATGVAAWARVADSTGLVIMDLNVSTTGGSGAIQLNTTNIVLGGPIGITSFVIAL